MGMLVTRDDEEGELDDLVSMIDQLMEQGSGHLTIDIDEGENGVKVHRFSTTDCGKTGACAQPTELTDDDDQ
ncbi:hypothetical protein SAMN02910317_00905 [Ruminococcaceae bacterium FB2012]|nr:hypothetical protein SAMN02910317_00905 [Ruminococcaceae bacterium FB2012]